MINLAKAPTGYYTILDFMAMNELERRIALQEYRNLVSQGLQAPGMALDLGTEVVQETKKKVRRKKSAYSRELSRQLKAANFAARTKSGRLRKGMTQAKILKKAHKMAKRRFK